MLRRIILARIASVEKDWGVPLDYCKFIIGVSLRASFKFAKFLAVDEYRRVLPRDPFYVARIVAVRDADCGTCVQIAVSQAKKAGVSAEILRAVVDGNLEDLSEELRDACSFAEAVVTANGEEDTLREHIRRRYGDEGLIEMALAIASCRTFPTIKRALGYAVSCSQVAVRVRADVPIGCAIPPFPMNCNRSMKQMQFGRRRQPPTGSGTSLTGWPI